MQDWLNDIPRRGDVFLIAVEGVHEQLAEVALLGGEGTNQTSFWLADAHWTSLIPDELFGPLVALAVPEGVPVVQAEQALRDLLEWLNEPLTHGDQFPDAVEQARNQLSNLAEFGDNDIYFNNYWAASNDVNEFPAELATRLRAFLLGVPARQAREALRDLEAWLNESVSGDHCDEFPEACALLDEQLAIVSALSDEELFWDFRWHDLVASGDLDGIPEDLVSNLLSLGGDHSGYPAREAESMLRELEEWLHSGGTMIGDTVELGTATTVDNLEVQVEYEDESAGGGAIRRIAIGIGGDDGVLLRPEGDETGPDVFPADYTTSFRLGDGTTLTLADIISLDDGGVIGLQEDVAGDSFLLGSVANDAIYGNDGDDRIQARANEDFVDGGAGEDRIAAGFGDDQVVGGSGDDIIAGGQGSDFVSGGDGSDTYAFNYGDGEDFLESDGDGSGSDTLSLGFVGLDQISGFIDDQGLLHLTVDGGGGGSITTPWLDPNDQGGEPPTRELRRIQLVSDGARVRIFDLESFVANFRSLLLAATAETPFAFDFLDGFEVTFSEAPAGGDSAVAYAQTGDLFGDPFFDSNEPSDGGDQLFGGEASDFIDAGNDDDAVSGGAGDDLLVGGGGNNTLVGGSGNDNLVGGDDDDRLIGGSGDDVLFPGPGNDRAQGGEGHDTYVFERGDGTLEIVDSGENTIVFGDGISFDELTLSHDGGFLEIRLSSAEDLIRLGGFNPADPLGTGAVSTLYFS